MRNEEVSQVTFIYIALIQYRQVQSSFTVKKPMQTELCQCAKLSQIQFCMHILSFLWVFSRWKAVCGGRCMAQGNLALPLSVLQHSTGRENSGFVQCRHELSGSSAVQQLKNVTTSMRKALSPSYRVHIPRIGTCAVPNISDAVCASQYCILVHHKLSCRLLYPLQHGEMG